MDMKLHCSYIRKNTLFLTHYEYSFKMLSFPADQKFIWSHKFKSIPTLLHVIIVFIRFRILGGLGGRGRQTVGMK